jgi:hypothetical protein
VGRKLGHITLPLSASDEADLEQQRCRRLAEVRAIWPLPPGNESRRSG